MRTYALQRVAVTAVAAVLATLYLSTCQIDSSSPTGNYDGSYLRGQVTDYFTHEPVSHVGVSIMFTKPQVFCSGSTDSNGMYSIPDYSDTRGPITWVVLTPPSENIGSFFDPFGAPFAVSKGDNLNFHVYPLASVRIHYSFDSTVVNGQKPRYVHGLSHSPPPGEQGHAPTLKDYTMDDLNVRFRTVQGCVFKHYYWVYRGSDTAFHEQTFSVEYGKPVQEFNLHCK